MKATGAVERPFAPWAVRHNEQLLLTARHGSGWLAPLACRTIDGAPQQNCGR